MYCRVFTRLTTTLNMVALNSHDLNFLLLSVGVTHVSSKENAIKCSSMKSSVFPFTLNFSQAESMTISLLFTPIVAQCMNNQL